MVVLYIYTWKGGYERAPIMCIIYVYILCISKTLPDQRSARRCLFASQSGWEVDSEKGRTSRQNNANERNQSPISSDCSKKNARQKQEKTLLAQQKNEHSKGPFRASGKRSARQRRGLSPLELWFPQKLRTNHYTFLTSASQCCMFDVGSTHLAGCKVFCPFLGFGPYATKFQWLLFRGHAFCCTAKDHKMLFFKRLYLLHILASCSDVVLHPVPWTDVIDSNGVLAQWMKPHL